MNVSESSLVHELSITFGYQSFKSELQKQAVTAVAGGIYCQFRIEHGDEALF